MKKRQCKRYIVSTLREGVLNRKIMTQRQRRQLGYESVDVEIDEPNGVVRIKDGKGKIKDFHLAKREWDLLLEVFWSLGDRYELVSDPNVNQAVHLLWLAFGDSKNLEKYFKTRTRPTYAIWLNTENVVWRFVEVLAEAAKSTNEDCSS